MRTDFTPNRLMNPLLAIGGALAVGNAIGKFIGGIKQKKESQKINPIWQQYQRSPFAKQQLGIANQMFQGRMPGAVSAERNIMASQGNAANNVNRLATDSSQALALNALGQEQASGSLNDLAMQEAMNKQNMLQNLNQAYGVNINEGDKEYQSMLQKYNMDAQRKDALYSSGAQNKFGAVSDLASMAFTGGTSGVFGGMFPGNKQQFNAGVNSAPIAGQRTMFTPNTAPTINPNLLRPR